MSDSIVTAFESLLSIPVKRVKIERDDFLHFKSIYQDSRSGIDDEKVFEYYLGYTWLDLKPTDVFMDVACQDCPFAFFVRDSVGCKVYRQDLYYVSNSTNDEDVACDATKLPFPDGALSKMSLFNSFEHFEGDKDIEFIEEAQRVLCKGGKLCIVPLYMGTGYGIEENAGWIDEHGEKQLWGVGARFARTYDAKSFVERVLKHCGNFDYEICVIENPTDISKQIHAQYFAVFERK
jgi:hypothetical protein